VKLTKDDLIQAYANGRDRGQAEGRAVLQHVQLENAQLLTRIHELEAQRGDLSRAVLEANRNVLQDMIDYLTEALAELPPSGGVADGVKSEPASDHGPARAAFVAEVPWADSKG
jgi:hypothetical protein